IMISRGHEPTRLTRNKHKWSAPSVRYSTQCRIKSTRIAICGYSKARKLFRHCRFCGPRAHQKTSLGQKRGAAAASEHQSHAIIALCPLVSIFRLVAGQQVWVPLMRLCLDEAHPLPAAASTGASGFAAYRLKSPNLHGSPVVDGENDYG